MTEDVEWQDYERFVAAIEAENHSSLEVVATLNTKLMGKFSGTLRQIDCLIDERFDSGFERRIIVDAKRYRRPLDVKDVEEFLGMMQDCSADRGIMICESGWSQAAARRVQDRIDIKIIPRSEIGDYSDYAVCDECICGKGVVFYDNKSIIQINGLYSISFIGRCDRCHSFNVWCWDCGDKFRIEDETEYRCNCGRLWYAAVSEGEDGTNPAATSTYLVMIEDDAELDIPDEERIYWVDRRRGF